MENITNGSSTSTPGTSNTPDGFMYKASSGAHAAVDTVASAADLAAGKVQPAISRVVTMAHNAVDQVASVAAPGADWLAEQGDALKSTQKKLVSDTCGYVAANPLKSVGMALVAGFILSHLIRSRS